LLCLSQCDPIAHAVAVLRDLRESSNNPAGRERFWGLGTTGYSTGPGSASPLGRTLRWLKRLAHAKASLRCIRCRSHYRCCGQDIKIILLRGGAVKDFKLNTQCSAGQRILPAGCGRGARGSHRGFCGGSISRRIEYAVQLRLRVFLQSDIVKFPAPGLEAGRDLGRLSHSAFPKTSFQYVPEFRMLLPLGRRIVHRRHAEKTSAVVRRKWISSASIITGTGSRNHGSPELLSRQGPSAPRSKPSSNTMTGQSTTFPGFQFLDTLRYEIRRDENHAAGHFARTLSAHLRRTEVVKVPANGPETGHHCHLRRASGKPLTARRSRFMEFPEHHSAPQLRSIGCGPGMVAVHPAAAATEFTAQVHVASYIRGTTKRAIRAPDAHRHSESPQISIRMAPLFSAYSRASEFPARKSALLALLKRRSVIQQAAGSPRSPLFPIQDLPSLSLRPAPKL